jgi:hypothetical protein
VAVAVRVLTQTQELLVLEALVAVVVVAMWHLLQIMRLLLAHQILVAVAVQVLITHHILQNMRVAQAALVS